MGLDAKDYKQGENKTPVEFVPLDKPLMSFMEAFEIVKVKYKNAFEYLKDK